MAVLAELFLVLAGFDSSLDSSRFQHPAEQDVFDRGYSFGRRFNEIRDACAEGHSVIHRTIEHQVVERYLNDLADVENQILDGLASAPAALRNAGLIRSAEIMNRVVESWTRRFDAALHLLSELGASDVAIARTIHEVHVMSRSYGGFRDVLELCDRCVVALDKQWLSELEVFSTSFASDELLDREFSAHPVLEGTPGESLLEGILLSVQQLGFQNAKGSVDLISAFLDVSDKNSDLIKTAAVPISAPQLTSVLEKVHHNILELIRSRVMHAQSVQALLKYLRTVLLFGHSEFVDEYCAAHGDISAAIESFSNRDEAFAKTIAHVEPVVTLDNDAAKFDIQWPLSLLFSSDQCAVYYSLHATLGTVVLALNEMKPGQGAAAHTYQLFLSMLWYGFQVAVDDAFAALYSAIETQGDLSIKSTQSRVLHNLVTRISLDSASIRSQLQAVVDHARANSRDLRPINELATSLSELPQGREMPLEPFLRAAS